MTDCLHRFLRPPLATVRISRQGWTVAAVGVEVAATIWRRARGLMGRSNLERDRGLLLVYPWRRVVRIWMADTPLALDAIFVAPGGNIVKIAPDLKPSSLHWTSSDVPVRWVLEMGAGSAARLGIRVGDGIEVSCAE